MKTKRENQLNEMNLKEMKEKEDALAEEMSAARARQKENTTQVHNAVFMWNDPPAVKIRFAISAGLVYTW